MRANLEKLFGGWRVEQPPVPPFPEVRAKPSAGVYLAVKRDVTQTFFALGHPGGLLRDKDYAALEVMADILGGGFRSRLVRRVRTDLGYAYNISAYWGVDYNHPGLFTISGSTKSGSTTEALQVVLEEIAKMRAQEVTPEELQAAKDAVLNSFVFNFDRPSKTLSRMVTQDYYGYPRDFIFQYQKAVSAVTRADILRVAKEYVKPENFTIVAVGNPPEFGKPLSALGTPVKEIELK
jgi:zinc protease